MELSELTNRELKNILRQNNVKNYSKLNKKDLVKKVNQLIKAQNGGNRNKKYKLKNLIGGEPQPSAETSPGNSPQPSAETSPQPSAETSTGTSTGTSNPSNSQSVNSSVNPLNAQSVNSSVNPLNAQSVNQLPNSSRNSAQRKNDCGACLIC